MHLLLPLLAMACVTPASFTASTTKASCKKLLECEEDAFDFLYSSLDDCQDALEPLAGGDCFVEYCDAFDGGSANTCVSEIRTSECGEEASSACLDVWSECNELALAACLLTGQ